MATLLPPALRPATARLHLWAVTVRDSFVVLLPLTLFGVVAVLLPNLPWPAFQALLAQAFGPGWTDAAGLLVRGTHGVFGAALAVIVGMQLARRLPVPAGGEALATQMVGVGSFANFTICLLVGGHTGLGSLGHDAMLLGMLCGIGTAEFVQRAQRARWLAALRLPYDVDPTVYHAARLTLPLLLSGLCAFAIASLFMHWQGPGIDVLRPLADVAAASGAGVWWMSACAALMNQVLWFVGVHGGHALDSYGAVFFAPAGAGFDDTRAWRPLFDAFALAGGSGATLGLVLALLLGARSGPQRRLGQLSLLPSMFNINELLVFGLPLALNPLYAVPFLLAPLVSVMIGVAAVQSGWMPLLNVSVPWTTPPLLSGWWLSGSWHGVAAQALAVAASTALYLPFVRRAEAARLAEQGRSFREATRAIVDDAARRMPSVQRNDQVGIIARGLLTDLRRDLAANRLTLAYQPKVDARGRVAGVEALLRWTHARHGPLPPDVVVTLAEESGDIDALGRWVIDAACACKAGWNAQGLRGLTMAVNVSPLQLSDGTLPDAVADALRRHGLRPGELELEITESQAIPATAAVDRTLQRLGALGVRLAMDDFGMGHASLLHLRRCRLHALKIDGSITRDVLVDDTSADIIRAIVALGRSRRVEIVAEFVETATQERLLRELGCQLFQGYLHSPPLPAAACADFIRGRGVAPRGARAAMQQQAAARASQPVPLAAD